ncbi:hypothetical protein FB45DRAFT_872656 [Roridomyces roridus]|uniref:Uncharacterized protein n=1 Tax=Roridomyces roridus TaxID=1738132 RepID=A0AAD7BDB4_9AGAR|nr:hypothetical protein FB45DRAFT_872656 [Roridomyces roridus]
MKPTSNNLDLTGAELSLCEKRLASGMLQPASARTPGSEDPVERRLEPVQKELRARAKATTRPQEGVEWVQHDGPSMASKTAQESKSGDDNWGDEDKDEDGGGERSGERQRRRERVLRRGNLAQRRGRVGSCCVGGEGQAERRLNRAVMLERQAMVTVVVVIGIDGVRYLSARAGERVSTGWAGRQGKESLRAQRRITDEQRENQEPAQPDEWVM